MAYDNMIRARPRHAANCQPKLPSRRTHFKCGVAYHTNIEIQEIQDVGQSMDISLSYATHVPTQYRRVTLACLRHMILAQTCRGGPTTIESATRPTTSYADAWPPVQLWLLPPRQAPWPRLPLPPWRPRRPLAWWTTTTAPAPVLHRQWLFLRLHRHRRSLRNLYTQLHATAHTHTHTQTHSLYSRRCRLPTADRLTVSPLVARTKATTMGQRMPATPAAA